MNRALAEPTSFHEDDPRPPVPGQEGEARCRRVPNKVSTMRPSERDSLKATRRDDEGLGEPEGSASPDSPLTRWTKSLHALLGDQDGARLFRVYLEREGCADLLDFWFACNGFRQMDLKDSKTHRVARAIYKRYVESDCVVARRLKPATKTFIRDNVKRQQIDSCMFDQAQTEIQSGMEDNAYQTFLQCDVYLEYVRSGGENPLHGSPGAIGSLKLVCGYLPTLNEEEEWSCNEFKTKALAMVGLSAKALQSTAPSLKTVEVLEKGYRSHRRFDPANSYHVASGCSFAPATSANDSEISSDAMTDDSMSVTDSSVDGIPPYKLGKKQLQREMQRNMRMNGQVSLPAFPRPLRPPQDMAPVKPAVFAAQLIAKLEKLRREQETMSSLEERLQQIQEEEEREESELTAFSQRRSCEDDPQAILDDHLSRVLRTPGCSSPGVARHSPRSHSPEPKPLTRAAPGGAAMPVYTPGRATVSKHVHHHHIHHHSTSKSKEQIEAEAARRVQGMCLAVPECCPATYSRSRSVGREQGDASTGSSKHLCKSAENGVDATLQLPTDSTDRSQNVWQWILESERQARHRPHSTQSTKKLYGSEARHGTHSWGGAGISGHLRAHQPVHPFVQDPAMPPLPPPNTLAQLEEACRRLEEVSKPPKQRHPTPGLQRDKSHAGAAQNGATSLQSQGPQTEEFPHSPKEPKKPCVSHASETVVTYFFCGEEIPYRRTLKTHNLTLGHFKEQLRKKGNYRYYFKKVSDEFECGAVFEEVWDDSTILPMYKGKILGKVERMD